MAKTITLSGGPTIFDKIRHESPGNIWMMFILFELLMIVLASLCGFMGVLLYVLLHIAPTYLVLAAGANGVIILTNRALVALFLILMVGTWIASVSIISVI